LDDNRSGESEQLCNLGIVARQSGDVVEAESFLENALALCRETGR
jgi:hypothetical protein